MERIETVRRAPQPATAAGAHTGLLRRPRRGTAKGAPPKRDALRPERSPDKDSARDPHELGRFVGVGDP
ncbi:hypothetical protein [Leifsonia xyli]|uniref:hypothetical protein n=1 Tax=Leifsonia xyli TaxID=1575 RepID=UPI0005C70034|nr:hypothetical protein [Leifsonia xyli]